MVPVLPCFKAVTRRRVMAFFTVLSPFYHRFCPLFPVLSRMFQTLLPKESPRVVRFPDRKTRMWRNVENVAESAEKGENPGVSPMVEG